MVARNDITGDKIKTRVGTTHVYENGFERIFRKKTKKELDSEAPPDKSASDGKCPEKEDCFCVGGCERERQKAIAQNGNTGEHYER